MAPTVPLVRQSVYVDPIADGDKVQFTPYGAATTWQALNKGVRQPTVPSSASGVRTSASGNLFRVQITTPSAPAGLWLNFIRVWFYVQAMPAEHVLTYRDMQVPAGYHPQVGSGWKSSAKLSPFRSADGGLVAAGETHIIQIQLTESVATAAETDVTAVYVEFGYSNMDHVVPYGPLMLGVPPTPTLRIYDKQSYAQYASIAFDGFMFTTNHAGNRQNIREMVERGLEMVRIFMPFGQGMTTYTTVNESAWQNFETFLGICEEEGIRLVVTGLCTFNSSTDHRPTWYDALTEGDRWHAQRQWWDRCARACAGSPAVAIYDLINEPFAQDGGSSWYLGGPPFDWASYLCKNLSGRTGPQVLGDWITNMRDIDSRGFGVWDRTHMLGVGIPITGSYAAPQIAMGWKDQAQTSVILPHLYLWAQSSLAQGLAELATYTAVGRPVLVEEAGLLDSHYGDAQLIDFLARMAYQPYLLGVQSGWRNAFTETADTSHSVMIHDTLRGIIKGKSTRYGRLGTARGLLSRVGARQR